MGKTHPGLEKSSGLLRQCPNSSCFQAAVVGCAVDLNTY